MINGRPVRRVGTWPGPTVTPFPARTPVTSRVECGRFAWVADALWGRGTILAPAGTFPESLEKGGPFVEVVAADRCAVPRWLRVASLDAPPELVRGHHPFSSRGSPAPLPGANYLPRVNSPVRAIVLASAATTAVSVIAKTRSPSLSTRCGQLPVAVSRRPARRSTPSSVTETPSAPERSSPVPSGSYDVNGKVASRCPG